MQRLIKPGSMPILRASGFPGNPKYNFAAVVGYQGAGWADFGGDSNLHLLYCRRSELHQRSKELFNKLYFTTLSFNFIHIPGRNARGQIKVSVP